MTSSITPVRIGKTRITDPLFGAYVNMVAEKVIPYQWEALNDRIPGVEKGYCIENFRVAAGLQPGHHQGAIFQDTDLYKWLEAVAFCIEYGAGDKFIPIADEVIALMEKAQEPDGYLNTYFTIACPEKKWTNLTEGHELYGCGHLIEAAVAYYNATGKDTVLNIACRFADLVDRTFGTEDGKCHGYPGHQEIELALVKLYKATGEKRYLNLANYFIRQRGDKPNYLLEEMKGRKGRNVFPEFAEYDDLYAQTHAKAVDQTTAVGHAVRAVYMYTAMADLARELQDEEMLRACQTLYDNITTRRMYITGGIGSSGKLERFTTDYDLPNDRMYCESCASVGLMMFSSGWATSQEMLTSTIRWSGPCATRFWEASPRMQTVTSTSTPWRSGRTTACPPPPCPTSSRCGRAGSPVPAVPPTSPEPWPPWDNTSTLRATIPSM